MDVRRPVVVVFPPDRSPGKRRGVPPRATLSPRQGLVWRMRTDDLLHRKSVNERTNVWGKGGKDTTFWALEGPVHPNRTDDPSERGRVPVPTRMMTQYKTTPTSMGRSRFTSPGFPHGSVSLPQGSLGPRRPPRLSRPQRLRPPTGAYPHCR